jgi:oligoendopeptidase F
MSIPRNLTEIPERKEVPAELKWRLEDIYASDELWETDMAKLQKKLPELASFQGRLGASAQNLLEGLNLLNEIDEMTAKVSVYARMRKDEDNTDPKYQAMYERAASLAVQVMSSAAFIRPELLAVEEDVLEKYLAGNPELELYRQFIHNISRMRANTLSASEERIVAMAGEVGLAISAIFTMVNNADLKFASIVDEDGNTVELTKGRYIKFMQSPDRRVRKDAYDAMYSSYGALLNTIGSTYSASVKSDAFNARVRNYGSCLEAALDQNNIPVDVYSNLLEAVRSRLDLMHRYIALRKKALDLDKVHMYDIYAPIVPDIDWPVTYAEAKKTVCEGLAPLGDEYVAALKKGLESGWVDVVENRGKTSGAYSWGEYGSHPFVLLNWQDNMDNMFTLAHEMGHAMHSHYSWATQPYVYSDYSIFLAEVASTANEVLLMKHLLGLTQDRARRMYLLNHLLEQFKGTLYRQTLFAEFEKATHEMFEAGKALTPDVFNDVYTKLNQDYYGDEIVLDDKIAIEWARIPHFYRAFYVYQYATGFSAAVALAEGILEHGAPATKRYIQFLSGGSSKYPIDLLAHAGVDMTSPDPIHRALDVFEKALEEMETYFGD